MDKQSIQTISVLELIEIIRRHKMVLFLSVILVLVPILLYNYFSTPVYQASATVVLEDYGQNTIVDFDLTKALSRGSIVANQVREMQTMAFAQRLYEELPEVKRRLFRLPHPLPVPFEVESYMVNSIGKSLAVRPITETDFIAITCASPNPELAATIANTAAKVLQTNNLNIRRQEYASLKNFIEEQIRVVSEKLHIAEDTLSLYKTGKNLISIDDESKEILQRITQAENLLNQVQAESDAAQKKLATIRKKLDVQKKNLAGAVVQISDPLTARLKEHLVELNVQYAGLQSQGRLDNHPKMVELRREIEQTRQELVRATTEILTGEELKGVIDPISQLKKNLEESILLEVEVRSLGAQKAGLQETLNRYLERLKELPQHERELVRLMRDREVNNKIYVRLLEEREQARIREAAEIGNIRIIELAPIPGAPSQPRKALNLIIGLFVGAVIGLVLIFAKEFMRNAPRNQDEAEQVLSLPVLTSVPQVKRGLSFSMNGHRDARLLINPGAVGSTLRDAYFYLCGAMELALPHSSCVVMITSACAAEGKSTVAANLAMMAALHGKKTILFDGDVRSPILHKVFGVLSSPGLTNVVSETTRLFTEFFDGQALLRLSVLEARFAEDPLRKLKLQDLRQTMHASIDKALQQIPALRTLRIFTAGDKSVEPHLLWSSPLLEEILSQLKQIADLIVIDSPPVIGIPDASFIAHHADGVLLCVEAAKTEKSVLQRAQKSLDRVHARFLGVVLNKVDPAALYGGYKYYRHYQRKYDGISATPKLLPGWNE